MWVRVSYWSAEWLMAVVHVAVHPCLGKQVRHFRFIFLSREARGKNKPKMPKSPRTSSPGERKALRSKAWSEVTLLISAGVYIFSKLINFSFVLSFLKTKFYWRNLVLTNYRTDEVSFLIYDFLTIFHWRNLVLANSRTDEFSLLTNSHVAHFSFSYVYKQ